MHQLHAVPFSKQINVNMIHPLHSFVLAANQTKLCKQGGEKGLQYLTNFSGLPSNGPGNEARLPH